MKHQTSDYKQSGIAQYLIIAETIRGWINSGLYKSGDAIATVGELAEQFGVARGTIQEALKELSSQGIIVTSRGKRSTVRQSPQLRPVFAKMDLGDLLFVDQIGKNRVKRLSFKVVTPDDALRESFDFGANERLTEYRSLAYLNDRPNALTTSYIPANSGTEIDTAAAETFEAKFKRIVDTAKQQERRMSALTANLEIATQLGISVGSPVLRYRCLFWHDKRKLDLYFESFLRSDDCEYRLDA